MKSYLFLIAILILTGIIACRPSDSTVSEQSSDSRDTSARDRINPGESTIQGGHDYTFLTDKMLHYEASSTVGKDPKEQPYAGQWIDLDPSGHYTAGKLDKQTHTGRWDYNHERTTLLLRPDDSSMPASEWKVMHNEDMIVFLGTQTYGNNATQIKLVRRESFPE